MLTRWAYSSCVGTHAALLRSKLITSRMKDAWLKLFSASSPPPPLLPPLISLPPSLKVPLACLCGGHVLLLCGDDLCSCGHPLPLQQDDAALLPPSDAQLPPLSATALPPGALPSPPAPQVSGCGQDALHHYTHLRIAHPHTYLFARTYTRLLCLGSSVCPSIVPPATFSCMPIESPSHQC